MVEHKNIRIQIEAFVFLAILQWVCKYIKTMVPVKNIIPISYGESKVINSRCKIFGNSYWWHSVVILSKSGFATWAHKFILAIAPYTIDVEINHINVGFKLQTWTRQEITWQDTLYLFDFVIWTVNMRKRVV